MQLAPGVLFVAADLRDAESVARACRGADVVFHLASAGEPQSDKKRGNLVSVVLISSRPIQCIGWVDIPFPDDIQPTAGACVHVSVMQHAIVCSPMDPKMTASHAHGF